MAGLLRLWRQAVVGSRLPMKQVLPGFTSSTGHRPPEALQAGSGGKQIANEAGVAFFY
jgi:hypothetical protein